MGRFISISTMYVPFNQYFGAKWPETWPQWSDDPTVMDHVWIEPLKI